MIKLVYEYINEFIGEDKLIEGLDEFARTNTDYKNSIDKLIKDIKKIKEENIDLLDNVFDKVFNLLINNNLYLELVEKMNANDIMLMITDYIMAKRVPKLDSETFNEVVETAINSGDDAKENCWRLTMNYAYENHNFDKIVDFMISTKDVGYVIELIDALHYSYNIDLFIDKIIKTQDKKFISDIINYDVAKSYISEEQIKKLENSIK